ncbi:hypothetical protein CPB86DRAFT_662286, partial [Serendipita vermifera]
CPEWDIFMIMLERRNLLTGPFVKRISSVHFPFPLPPQLFPSIRDILAGKWTTRPSNLALSLAGNSERILDLSLPGCYLCHRALRVCHALVRTNSNTLFSDVVREQQGSRMQEYPDNEEQILATWRERAELW